MKVEIIPSSWLIREGHRLDCQPFTSGGITARMTVEQTSFKKNLLKQVTLNGLNGIYHVGQEKIHWVESAEYGIPFLRSSDILRVNLDNLTFISKEQVSKNPLFLFPAGSTLITRSGSIGKTVYAREEMVGMAASQDVLKVVPDSDKIPPGYLYAYLSSIYGMPQVICGTFGSIIVHIEAENIADLPVPRLGKNIEEEVHELIDNAAQNRVVASKLLIEAGLDIIDYFGLNNPKKNCKYTRPSVNYVSSSSIVQRMDAYYYAQWNEDAYAEFTTLPADKLASLDDITADLYIPGIFKRVYAEDPAYGYPYITGADVFCLAPISERYLSKKIPDIEKLVLRNGMILVQDSGQLGGLIGRPVPVGRYLDGFACTNNMVRIVPYSKADQGYIFAVLNTEYGIRLLTREATGSSIPHLDEKRVKRIQIPWTDEKTRELLGKKVLEAIELRDDACDLEVKARAIVENAIEGDV